jgi:hypothetical protein
MENQINLKEIEKRAFRSTYQDGLWDIYYGLIVVFMAIFLDRPEEGFTSLNIILMLIGFAAAYGLFFLAKRFITSPRLGQVKFGGVRKKRNKIFAWVMGSFIFCQVILLGITTLGWLNPAFGERLSALIGGHSNEYLFVSLIGSCIVGIGMLVSAYFSEFLRGYYIAILMALAVFLMLFYDQPVFPAIIGALIIIPGVMLLVRFLRQYPLHPAEVTHG